MLKNARVLRLAFSVARHRLCKIHPVEVQAAVTNRCDGRCVFCVCPFSQVSEMNTAQWADTIRQLGRHGTLRIKFQGGEPTLREDFAELCAAARSAGMIASAVTHGGHIAANPRLLDGLDEVVLSMDARNPEIHDQLRGKGTHGRALRAMDLALSAGKRVYVNMVASKPTLGEIEPLLRLCEERGVGFHAQPLNLGWHYSERNQRALALSNDEIREMHRQLARWKRAGRPLMFAAETYEKVTRWPDYDVHTRTVAGLSSCMAGRDYIHIEPNGDVHPCGIHEGEFTPKNVLVDGFTGAVENARRHTCSDCWIAYLNERKALFGLKPYAVRAFLLRR